MKRALKVKLYFQIKFLDKMNLKLALIFCIFFTLASNFYAQNSSENKKHYTHQDSLRGSITPERNWWDLTYYDLEVNVDPKTKTICFWTVSRWLRLRLRLYSLNSKIGNKTNSFLRHYFWEKCPRITSTSMSCWVYRI